MTDPIPEVSRSKPDHPRDASIPFHLNESAVEFSELSEMTRNEDFPLRHLSINPDHRQV
jgi:hypothetical protein